MNTSAVLSHIPTQIQKGSVPQMNFAKGMAIGLAIGAGAALFMDPLSDKQRNKLQKKTEGVFRSIGSMIDTAMEIMR